MGETSTSISNRSCKWDLPLLTKELTELAARPRTYRIRAIYAAALVLSFCFYIEISAIAFETTGASILGRGAHVLVYLVVASTLAIYLILPVMACGALTVERERKTLDLLLLTPLGTGTIILEKFFSRLIPALNFLLISAPVLGFCYAFGGISAFSLILIFAGLSVSIVRVTSVAILCSAASKSNTEAFLLTYLLTLTLQVVDVFIVTTFAELFSTNIRSVLFPNAAQQIGLTELLNAAVPAMRFLDLQEYWVPRCVAFLILAVPSLALSSALLLWARSHLNASTRTSAGRFVTSERGAITARSRRMSGISERRANLIEKSGDEAGLKSTSWFNQIIVIALFVMPPLMATSVASLVQTGRIAITSTAPVTFTVWLILIPILAIKAANVIVKERTQQTLSVLATVPLSGPEVIRMIMAKLERPVAVGRTALLLCLVYRMGIAPQLWYLTHFLFMIWVFPELIVWQGAACSMSSKSGSEALMKTILILTLSCAIPPLIASLISTFVYGIDNHPMLKWLPTIVSSLNPLELLSVTETAIDVNYHQGAFVRPLVTAISTGALLIYLRRKVLSGADRCLGRI